MGGRVSHSKTTRHDQRPCVDWCNFPVPFNSHARDVPTQSQRRARRFASTASMLSTVRGFLLRYSTLAATKAFHSLRSLFANTLALLLPLNMAFAPPPRTTNQNS